MKPHPLLDLLGSQTPPPTPRGRVVRRLGAWIENNADDIAPEAPKPPPGPTLTDRAYALLLLRSRSKDELAIALQCKKGSLTNVITKLNKAHLITKTGNSRADNVVYHAIKPTKQRTAK